MLIRSRKKVHLEDSYNELVNKIEKIQNIRSMYYVSYLELTNFKVILIR